ncbi:capsular polysaccharide biosynthesis protein [Sphingobium sp. TomTYG75]
MAKADTNVIGFRIENISPEAIAALDAASPVAEGALSFLNASGRPERSDIIRPGDMLNISIFEVGFTLFGSAVTALDTKLENTPGNAQRIGIRVDDDGNITLPYIGKLIVAGLTPEQVQAHIEIRLSGLSQNPQALVIITDSIQNSVYVSGAVARPGRFRLEPGQERILDLVTLAGGPTAETDNIELHVVREQRAADIRLGELHAEDEDNISLAPGDRIELINRPRSYTVFGASDHVSQVPFGIGRVSLAEALARAGGPSDNRADPKGVFLFRYLKKPEGADDPVIYRVNLMDPQNYFLAQRLTMRDKDLIYFSNAPANIPAKFISILNQLISPVVTARILTQ